MNTVAPPINSTCLANQTLLLPDYVDKEEKLQSQVILHVTTGNGELSYHPDGGNGWVWEYLTTN